MLGAKAIARAKINLFLDVGPRRRDGFHEIVSVMQTLDLSDELFFRRTDGAGGPLSLRCSDRCVPLDEGNIVWKAFEVFMEKTGAAMQGGVEVFINKRIPVGAGLAGGSADGAATLMAMDRMLELDLLESELVEMAALVGSDVPFCMRGGTSLVRGRGELLETLDSLPAFNVVVAAPEEQASTARVYEKFDELVPEPEMLSAEKMVDAVSARDLEAICAALHNGLERAATALDLVTDFKRVASEAGSSGVLMTGSGPAIFAMVRGLDEAAEVALELGQIAPVTIITSFADKGAELG